MRGRDTYEIIKKRQLFYYPEIIGNACIACCIYQRQFDLPILLSQSRKTQGIGQAEKILSECVIYWTC